MAFLVQMITSLLIQFVFISIIAYVLYLIVDKWITRSIRVRQEQNKLLQELIRVMEKK